MNPFRATPFLALVSLAVAAAPAAADPRPARAEQTVRESYALTESGGRRFLLIDNVTGAVAVEAGGGDRVEVEIVQRFEAKTAAALERARAEVELKVETEPGRLALIQDGPFRCDRAERRFLCREAQSDRDYEVTFDWRVKVPRTVDLTVWNVNGGAVEIAGVHGRIEATNVNDAVVITDVAGTVDASTVNGPLKASFAELPAGDLEFSSVNGELDLSFPPGFGAELRARTLNGEVLTDFPAQALSPARPAERQGRGPGRHRSGGTAIRIGEGGGRLDCSTVNGDILIRVRGARP